MRAAEGDPHPFVEAAEGRLLYMGTGEAINIAKTYTRINKYALNMNIYKYVYNILNILQHPSSVTSLLQGPKGLKNI